MKAKQTLSKLGISPKTNSKTRYSRRLKEVSKRSRSSGYSTFSENEKLLNEATTKDASTTTPEDGSLDTKTHNHTEITLRPTSKRRKLNPRRVMFAASDWTVTSNNNNSLEERHIKDIFLPETEKKNSKSSKPPAVILGTSAGVKKDKRKRSMRTNKQKELGHQVSDDYDWNALVVVPPQFQTISNDASILKKETKSTMKEEMETSSQYNHNNRSLKTDSMESEPVPVDENDSVVDTKEELSKISSSPTMEEMYTYEEIATMPVISNREKEVFTQVSTDEDDQTLIEVSNETLSETMDSSMILVEEKEKIDEADTNKTDTECHSKDTNNSLIQEEYLHNSSKEPESEKDTIVSQDHITITVYQDTIESIVVTASNDSSVCGITETEAVENTDVPAENTTLDIIEDPEQTSAISTDSYITTSMTTVYSSTVDSSMNFEDTPNYSSETHASELTKEEVAMEIEPENTASSIKQESMESVVSVEENITAKKSLWSKLFSFLK
ncbi:hypothetical protein BDF14DRAFT_1877175 [Spinellus fusiger]|nr:hypothetical protein BDF14DRAFT_1877175 [Spinellus fusiger]